MDVTELLRDSVQNKSNFLKNFIITPVPSSVENCRLEAEDSIKVLICEILALVLIRLNSTLKERESWHQEVPIKTASLWKVQRQLNN